MEDLSQQMQIQAPVLEMASTELETIKLTSGKCHNFPPAALILLKALRGNNRCIDCGDSDPQWATVSYGALLCLQCSGLHRSLGVQVSCVRSIAMDEWLHSEILAMLEGGNEQLQEFFTRHELCREANNGTSNDVITKENVTLMRYKTKAALFYRQQLSLHVAKVQESGEYQGREVSRRRDNHRMLHERNSTVS